MLTTNDRALWSMMWSFKDHGKSWEAVYERQHPPGFRWLHESFGTNWRMLEMQAVIGRIQLHRMGEWKRQRSAHARAILAACRAHAVVRAPELSADCEHAYYKVYVYVQPEQLAAGWNRDRIIEALNAQGVPCYQGSCSEVYLEKAFEGTPWRPSAPLPVAQLLGETSLMFLTHPTLTPVEIDKTCSAIHKVMQQVTR